jgi:hypothetical protein
MNNTVQRSATTKLVKRSALLTVAFISVQLFIPAFAVPIQPNTNGFIYDIGATSFVAPTVSVNNIDVPFYNPYVTQLCGNSCTLDDYKNAILLGKQSTIEIGIPAPLFAKNNLLPTTTPVQYNFPANYSAFEAYQQFVYSSKQPDGANNPFLYSADPTIINPRSVVLGNSNWQDCQALKVCLTWAMSWEVSQTPPSDFTPGTMTSTAIYLVNSNNGNTFHYIAESPVTFASNSTLNGNRINGWQWKYGNYGMAYTQTNIPLQDNGEPIIYTDDAVELIGVGAQYTSNIDGKKKWAFLYEYDGMPLPPTYARLKIIDSYCDSNNNCQDSESFTAPKLVNENGDTVFDTNKPNSIDNKEVIKTEIIIQTKDPITNTYKDKDTVMKVQIEDLQNLPIQTQQCVFNSSKCIVALYKATPNGFVQCTVGNTNVDCSEWVAGVPQAPLANLYQCRINGISQSLEKCNQLQGKYLQPVPEFADSDGEAAPLSCAPPGFQILNPLVFVQSFSCVLEYLFIPKTTISDYYNAYKLNIESTILVFPEQFFHDFTDPITNQDFTYDEADCMGLMFEVPVHDVLEGTLYSNAVSENLKMYPFQACSDQGKTLSSLARSIEGMLIMLASSFISIRAVTSALGINFPFVNNKGRKERIGI